MEKRYQSRWGPATTQAPAHDDAGNALPSAITTNMTAEQLDFYVIHFRVQEITRQLRLPDNSLLRETQASKIFRGPAPDPEYNALGRKINTPMRRLRQSLETERHELIQAATAIVPRYQPPFDYSPPRSYDEKIYIPTTDFPSVNFIGQLLGPRGSTLKELQKTSGAGIAIRGKGSVKEGRGNDRAKTNDEDKPLHVVIVADSQAKVEKGKILVKEVIDMAASTPEWQNDHKRQQLRDLAVANGTFRDDEGVFARQTVQTSRLPCDMGECQTQTPGVGDGRQSLSDFEEKYDRMMDDILGSKCVSANHQQGKAWGNLPPWRVDRLKQKGLLL